MDSSTLQSIRDLGIGIVGILAIGYLCYLLLKELQQNRKDYTSFVNENNHEKSTLIQKHTEVIMEVKESINTNTEVVKQLLNVHLNK